MTKPNFIFKLFLFVSLFSVANVFAQTENKQPQAAPCYEIVLQILVASNNAGEKSALPPTLSNVVKKLKSQYNFSDYRLTDTFLQRTSDSIEYKSVLNDFNLSSEKSYPVFSEWSLRSLRNLPNQTGRGVLQFEGFRFGARVPVIVSGQQNNGTAVVNYEQIGITSSRLTLNENEPTVIGTLATSKSGELMILVLTVKSVE